jgi:hypothetical protein
LLSEENSIKDTVRLSGPMSDSIVYQCTVTLTENEEDDATETITEIKHSSVLGQLLIAKETKSVSGLNKLYNSLRSQ